MIAAIVVGVAIEPMFVLCSMFVTGIAFRDPLIGGLIASAALIWRESRV